MATIVLHGVPNPLEYGADLVAAAPFPGEEPGDEPGDFYADAMETV